MTLPKCPHCGKLAGVYVKMQLIGWYTERFDETGSFLFSNQSDMDPSRHGVLRCVNCEEVRHDLTLVESRVVPNGRDS